MAVSSRRRPVASCSAAGSEPSPPAFETAIASALPWTPAMGAWTIGTSIPNNSSMRMRCSGKSPWERSPDRHLGADVAVQRCMQTRWKVDVGAEGQERGLLVGHGHAIHPG